MAKEVDEATAFIEGLSKPYVPMVIDIHSSPELGYILENLAKVLSEVFGIPYEELCRLPQLDIMVARVDRAYRGFVDELLSSGYLAYVRRDVSERESEDHVMMKALAVKYINERLNVKPERIACTFKVGDEVVADVYVEEKALAVECETLLGTGPAPLLKVLESVRKYVERATTKPVNEVWVIVRNWSATLHLGDLLWAENTLKGELRKQGKDVKFFVPDIYRGSLKRISEVARSLLSAGLNRWAPT
jgi:hypothetical protein